MTMPVQNRTNLVLFQAKTLASDPDGFNDTVSWQEHCKAWVSLNPNRGREVTRDQTQQSIVSHTVRGDWMELRDVTPEMRMLFIETGDYLSADLSVDDPAGYRMFDVVGVMNDEDHHADTMITVEEKRFGIGS